MLVNSYEQSELRTPFALPSSLSVVATLSSVTPGSEPLNFFFVPYNGLLPRLVCKVHLCSFCSHLWNSKTLWILTATTTLGTQSFSPRLLYGNIFLTVTASFLCQPSFDHITSLLKILQSFPGLVKISPNSLFKHSRAFSSLTVSTYLYSLSLN